MKWSERHPKPGDGCLVFSDSDHVGLDFRYSCGTTGYSRSEIKLLGAKLVPPNWGGGQNRGRDPQDLLERRQDPRSAGDKSDKLENLSLPIRNLMVCCRDLIDCVMMIKDAHSGTKCFPRMIQ